MAKFCGNCGTRLDDSAKVCGHCGTPLGGNTSNSTSTVPGVEYVDPEKKAKNAKRTKMIIGGVALLIVAIIVINIVSGFVGYKGAVRKVMDAYKEYDIDTLISMTSDLRLDMFDTFSAEYATEYYEGIVSEDLNKFDDVVGHNHKISYEITETYEMSERNVDDLLDSIAVFVEYVEDYDISKVMVVEVKVTAKEGKKSSSTTLTLNLVKEDGSWKLIYME